MVITDGTKGGKPAGAGRLKRLAWFAGLWLAGVIAVAALGVVVRLLLSI